MSYTERWTEVNAVLDVFPPGDRNVGVDQSDWVSLENYDRFVFIFQVGEMDAGATVDVLLREATSAAGAGAANIAGKALTQITDGDDNSYYAIELRGEEMTNAYSFVQAQVTVGVNHVDYSGWLLGIVPKYPAVDVTGFDEVVD